jgi:hypothetical protein
MVVKADFVSLFDAISRGFLQRLKWNLGEIRLRTRERRVFESLEKRQKEAWRRV